MPKTQQPVADRIGRTVNRARRDERRIGLEDARLQPEQTKEQYKEKIMRRERVAYGDKK